MHQAEFMMLVDQVEFTEILAVMARFKICADELSLMAMS